MNNSQPYNQRIISMKDYRALHPESDRITPLPMLSPLSDNSPQSSDYSDYTVQLGGSIRSAAKDKGSHSSLRYTGPVESRNSFNECHVSPLGNQKATFKLSRCNGSLQSLHKSRLSSAPPSTPPFGGKRPIPRSRLSQNPFKKNTSETDGSTSSFLTSTSFSSISSLPFSSLSSSSSTNWSSASSLKNDVLSISIVQRSSSKEVKATLTQLAESTEASASEEVVEAQCAMIARIAKDAYYQVVISKYGGARILCHILKHFCHNASIVESCCSTMQQMPHSPHLQEHAVELLLSVMEDHPDSIHVQSAACQTLLAILGIGNSSYDIPRLSELLDRAAHMYLTPAGLQSLHSLRKLLLERSSTVDK